MSKTEKKINVAVISAGGRSCGVVNRLLQDSDRNVKILTVFDPDKNQCEIAKKNWDSPDAVICDSYQEAIDFQELTG